MEVTQALSNLWLLGHNKGLNVSDRHCMSQTQPDVTCGGGCLWYMATEFLETGCCGFGGLDAQELLLI